MIATEEMTINTPYQQNGDTLMESLAAAAQARDDDTFIDLIRHLDWSQRTPEEMHATIRYAFKMGMSKLPLDLVKKGFELFPEHAEFQRLHRQLFPKNPVRKSKIKRPPIKGFHESVAWLEENAYEYRYKWIGVNKGKLVGVSDTYQGLREMLEGIEDRESTFVQRVL